MTDLTPYRPAQLQRNGQRRREPSDYTTEVVEVVHRYEVHYADESYKDDWRFLNRSVFVLAVCCVMVLSCAAGFELFDVLEKVVRLLGG